MTDLFLDPSENLLPYDGTLHDLGIVYNNTNELYERLLSELPWQSDKVTLFGKTHITTRQIVWMGDNNLNYCYAGQSHLAVAWSKLMFHVKQYVEQELSKIGTEVKFNSCLLNYYPTGSDGMGYHADDEKELGEQPIIAALSLGATRKFVFKHKKTQDKVSLYLESGQLIVMSGVTQNFWKHTITKTKTQDNGRISLTFRHIYPNK